MRQRLLAVSVHIIFVIIICVLPEMLMRYAAVGKYSHRTGIPWWFYAKSGLMILVFYLNYFVLIDRSVGRRRGWWRLIGENLVVILSCVALMMLLGSVFHPPYTPRQLTVGQHLAAGVSFMLRDTIILVLTVSLAVSLRMSARWQDTELKHRRLVAEQREAELLSLRSQLNPHFLFNTLNTIYALIEISPDDARRAVHDLSALLRYAVYENPDSVDIAREVELVSNYVALMRLRLGDRPVNFDIAMRNTRPVSVPPMLFATLVENAFKHGVTSSTADPISFRLDVDDSRLTFTTDNRINRPGDTDGGGVGLANLRRMLELVYGNRAALTVDNASARYTATLTIDLS